MIKLIACDMDGTLLDEKGALGDGFFEVLDALTKRGVKFVAASGRQYHQLFNNFGERGKDIIFVAENGTLIKHHGQELKSAVMNRQDVLAVLQAGEKLPHMNFILCCKDCAYINTDRKEVLEEVKKYYFNYEIVEDLKTIEKDALKIAILDLKGAEENAYKLLYPLFKDRLQIIVSGDIWLDIWSPGANKGTAIKYLQDKFDITRDETMVFGDYFNDVEMLKMAHYSYAMANAPDGVKAHANFIAKSNRENGVLEAIKEVILTE